MLGSPSEAWKYVAKHYRTLPATEKASLEDEWQSLQMVDGALPPELSDERGSFLRNTKNSTSVSRSQRKTDISQDASRPHVNSNKSLVAKRVITNEKLISRRWEGGSPGRKAYRSGGATAAQSSTTLPPQQLLQKPTSFPAAVLFLAQQ